MTGTSAPATGDELAPARAPDALAVVADVLAPLVARGLIVRRRRVTDALDRLDADRRAIRRMQRLRDRYGEGPLPLRLPGRRLALVLASADVRRVLDETPDPFTPATREKRAALARFEPHGVLISGGRDRERRRELNERALETGSTAHALAGRFGEVIDEEAAAILDAARAAGVLDWPRFAPGWWRIVRRIVLGDGARDDTEITAQLARLRADANWGPLRPPRSDLTADFLARLRGYVKRAEPGSLAAALAAAPGSDATASVEQVPQWLFAFDAAGMTSLRALALVDAHDVPATDSALRETVLESLRLWPTTPAILRDSTRATEWAQGTLPAETGLVIYAPFFHRDDRRLPEADAFAPQLWRQPDAIDAWPLVPFSRGPAQCPGRDIVLWTTSRLLAALLGHGPLRQRAPAPVAPDASLPATLSPFRLAFALA